MARSRRLPVAPLLFAFAALGLAGLGVPASGGCIPTYTFGEPGLADASGDGSAPSPGADAGGPDGTTLDASLDGTPPPADANSGLDGNPAPPHDAGIDSPAPSDASAPPAAIVSAGSKSFATGFGYQLHLVYAQNDARYWLFYVDDTASVIKTMTSRDLLTWTNGGVVSLASGFTLADGNDFSVAYANLGGVDVVHIVANSVASSRYTTFHIRATLAGGTITGTPAVALPDTDSNGATGSSGGTCPQDGPATIIASDGRVWDVTAWTGHPSQSTTCDTNVYVSPAPDTGAAWNPAPFAHDGYFVSLPSFAYAHTLVDLPDSGTVLALYPDYDNASLYVFDSVGWALSSTFDGGGGPTSVGVRENPADELFAGLGTTASYNDWTACRLTDTSVHLVRHVFNATGNSVSGFQELVYGSAGAGAWQATAAIPGPVSSLSNTGLVLVSDANPAHGLLLATIGVDNAVNVFKWTTAGGAWAPALVLPGSALRQSLGGSGCGSAHPMIFWTEGATAPFSLMKADLSALLGP